MKYEIKINNNIQEIELLEKNNQFYKVKLDNEIFEIDIVKVEEMAYSVLHNGKSFNIEIIKSKLRNTYIGHSLYKTFDIEIIDSQTKYLKSKGKFISGENKNSINSPMPGKVVRILVSEGDEIQAGQPVIVVSAMKMENEYKSGAKAIVKKILVKEGDTVDNNQTLISLEILE
jgi:biotin carboxyl carrier protein